MPLSRSRDYLSIGEVLEAVRADFPDVSISKIRFLESEGLIRPERTGSGYRKFYDADVARLRYILQLQRDQFLPLKVIRDRLAAADNNGGVYPDGAAPAGNESAGAPAAEVRAPEQPAEPDLTWVSLTRDELRDSAGLDEGQLRQLEEFGVLAAGKDSYDGDDLVAARTAREFFSFGVEGRHLRMYRQFVDRELALFEQLVTPLLRQRNPEARRQATRQLDKLATLTDRMKRSLLARALRGYVHGA